MGIASEIRRLLTGSILEPSFWIAKGLPVFKHYKNFRLRQWDSPEIFKMRQKCTLSALLSHTCQNIQFYSSFQSKNFLKEIEQDPFKALDSMPILEKEDLNASRERLFVEMGRGTYPNSSSGSTGTPTKFMQDKVYQAATLAATTLLFDWAGRPPGAPGVKFWGALRDIVNGKSDFKTRLASLLGNRLIFNSFSMTSAQMQDYVERIEHFKPWVIEGYADSLFEFCKFIQRHDYKMEYSPRGVITSASTLLPHMRTLIEETLKASVFDRYGSRETGNMAAECVEHKGLHVMGETTILEVVDNHGLPVGQDKEGEILVTNLWNYTMPFIRYRIGDKGTLSSYQCPCGRAYPLLGQLSGRTAESFRRKDHSIVSQRFFTSLIGLLHNDGTIHKFQVVQTDYDHVVLRLVPRTVLNLNQWQPRKKIIKHVKKIMGDDCIVDFTIEREIEKTRTGKHLYTISQLNID